MMFLEIDYAVYKLLTGYPLDKQGRPEVDAQGVPVNRAAFGVGSSGRKPSYGIRIPQTVAGFDPKRGLTSQDPEALRMFTKGFSPGTFKQVPVYDENLEGRKFADIWPSVTFRQEFFEFNPATYVTETLTCPEPGSPLLNVLNARGEVVATGYESYTQRPHPEAFDVSYTITIHAKNRIERDLISQQILNLIPARTALEVEYQDGATHICDMLLTDTATLDFNAADLGMSLTGEEQRLYTRAFTYLVEGYFDNTTNQFGMTDVTRYRAITERLFELANIQSVLVEPQYNPDDSFVVI